MSLDNFIPAVWSAQLIRANEKALVYGNVANRNYEGEISAFGDQVRINEIGAVTVATYTKNSTVIAPETLEDAQRILEINQSKYFAFEIDSIDKAQQKPKVMNDAMQEAGYALRDAADQYIASLHGDAGIISGLGTTATPIEINSSNVIDYISLVGQKMNENNVPTIDRYLVCPPWFFNKLNLAKITLQNPNENFLVEGHMGRVLGINLFMSNNVVNTSSAKYKIIGGVGNSISFAAQILDMQAYKPESAFSDALKGLYVYGAKVVRPDNTVCLTANIAAES